MLTKNFTQEEVLCKCGCGSLPTVRAMVQLQTLRDLYGKPMRITSAARCKAHNVAVGGSLSSKHLDGIAFDVIIPTEDRYKFVLLAAKLGFHGIGIASSFIHIDLRDAAVARIWSY